MLFEADQGILVGTDLAADYILAEVSRMFSEED